MFKTAYLKTLVVALSLGLLAGCSHKRTDAEIASDVQNRINADVTINTRQVSVASNEGIVTLSGTVGSDAERAAAATDASQIQGVKTILNNLQVIPAAASTSAQNAPQSHPKGNASTSKARKPETLPSNRAGNSSATQTTPAATVPEGTSISIRLVDAIDSEKSSPGDAFAATLEEPLVADGRVVAPKNSDVEGKIQEVKSAGHFAGRSEIVLVLTKLTLHGKSYPLSTEEYTQAGSSRGKRTAATVGGGAAVGALIGGLAGGGKGALIGAGAGAGAGTGIQAVTKGQQIRLPSESLLEFRLSAPITIR